MPVVAAPWLVRLNVQSIPPPSPIAINRDTNSQRGGAGRGAPCGHPQGAPLRHCPAARTSANTSANPARHRHTPPHSVSNNIDHSGPPKVSNIDTSWMIAACNSNWAADAAKNTTVASQMSFKERDAKATPTART